MKTILYPLFISVFVSYYAVGQQISIYDNYAELAEDNFINNDTTYVINFWATWCGPCVKELPYFESFHHNNSSKKVKVILVSLDFKNKIESQLLPFIKKNRLDAKTIALTDRDYNKWLTIVDKDWSGSIPATLLIHGNKKKFTEREFESVADLTEYVFSFISSL